MKEFANRVVIGSMVLLVGGSVSLPAYAAGSPVFLPLPCRESPDIAPAAQRYFRSCSELQAEVNQTLTEHTRQKLRDWSEGRQRSLIEESSKSILNMAFGTTGGAALPEGSPSGRFGKFCLLTEGEEERASRAFEASLGSNSPQREGQSCGTPRYWAGEFVDSSTDIPKIYVRRDGVAPDLRYGTREERYVLGAQVESYRSCDRRIRFEIAQESRPGVFLQACGELQSMDYLQSVTQASQLAGTGLTRVLSAQRSRLSSSDFEGDFVGKFCPQSGIQDRQSTNLEEGAHRDAVCRFAAARAKLETYFKYMALCELTARQTRLWLTHQSRITEEPMVILGTLIVDRLNNGPQYEFPEDFVDLARSIRLEVPSGIPMMDEVTRQVNAQYPAKLASGMRSLVERLFPSQAAIACDVGGG